MYAFYSKFGPSMYTLTNPSKSVPNIIEVSGKLIQLFSDHLHIYKDKLFQERLEGRTFEER